MVKDGNEFDKRNNLTVVSSFRQLFSWMCVDALDEIQ